ncbi:adenylate kinase family protein [Fimbriiglobus ruber]|uniref:Adenylate kinase n=1 Tax=Fimbriiglobus ruber TaxID=1908690 RepID=A0A225DCW5_9BACT|nr:nucleoside monophosphate kinase [Fimbriiglobus ruber]OWK36378.1 adenylate kinase [Fimbriiglobus ruber]
MRVVLIGPPGSGKGTQAGLLGARLNLTSVGTGEILRAAVRQNTPIGQAVGPLINQGLLAPDSVVNDLVAELFRGAQRPDNFVTDGYPRTLAQAVAFDALLRQQFLQLDAVVNLAIGDDEVVRRIGNRRSCPNPTCGASYNLLTRPPKKAGICERCGAALVLREDDREETVRRRLNEFHRCTDSLLEHYDRQGLLRTVSALDPAETTFANIVRSTGVK